MQENLEDKKSVGVHNHSVYMANERTFLQEEGEKNDR
jgi:hypothetical protein